MPSRNTDFVVIGNGNNIATNDSDGTVTVNGRTYELPENGTLIVEGNRVSTRTDRR